MSPWTRIAVAGLALASGQIGLAQRVSAGSQPATAPGELVVDGQVVGKLVEPRRGEICLLCNEPLRAGDAVYLVEGQRVPVHLGACNDYLLAQPQPWLARLKARGAFLSAVPNPGELSSAWFLAGLYVLLGLVFAALCAHRALHAGYSPVVWFGAGLVFTAFAYLLLLTRPRRALLAPAGVPAGLRKIPATYAPKACPQCGAANHPSARECLGCGVRLEPVLASEAQRIGVQPN